MATIAESSTAEVPIAKSSTAEAVRTELSRITGQSQWKDNDYWRDFMEGRRGIFEDIRELREVQGKDWTKASVAAEVDKQFVTRAQAAWEQNTELSWALQGGWLKNRPDIVRWMSASYWRHNKKHIKSPRVNQPPPADRLNSSEKPTGDNSGGEASGSTWKDVMLQ